MLAQKAPQLKAASQQGQTKQKNQIVFISVALLYPRIAWFLSISLQVQEPFYLSIPSL